MRNIESYRVRGNELREQIKSDIKGLLFDWLDRLNEKENMTEQSFVEFLAYNRARFKEVGLLTDSEFDEWVSEWYCRKN